MPFSDSRLTALLAPALGGNSKTVVLVTADPSPMHAGETIQVSGGQTDGQTAIVACGGASNAVLGRLLLRCRLISTAVDWRCRAGAVQLAQTLRFGERCGSVTTSASAASRALALVLAALDDEIADAEAEVRRKETWQNVRRTRADERSVFDAPADALSGSAAAGSAAGEPVGTSETILTSVLGGAEKERERLEALLARRRRLLGEDL